MTIGQLSDRDLMMFSLGLYAGEGAKTRGTIGFANTNPIYIAVMVAWLRMQFDIEESRLRAKVYLHDGLDLDAAEAFWSRVLEIPLNQFSLGIWRKMGQTIVLVTHNLDEAVTLSDRVLVLSSAPSRVILDHRIDMPHPRDVFTVRETAAFAHHFQAIWRVLGEQFKLSGVEELRTPAQAA